MKMYEEINDIIMSIVLGILTVIVVKLCIDTPTVIIEEKK